MELTKRQLRNLLIKAYDDGLHEMQKEPFDEWVDKIIATLRRREQ